MTAPIQYGTQPPPDPTAVMGRRTLAWIADLLLYGAVVAAGFASMAEYTDIPPEVSEADACDLFEQQNPGAVDGCIAYDGQLFLLDGSEAGVQTLLSFGWFAFFVLLQGFAGGSPGKLLFGLRVVDQYGNRCGLGKSLGRTLMWVVDAAPWFVPLVGPITAFTSTGHRRVGDLAAGTYVVSSSRVGSPVMPDTAAPPPGQTPWGAPPPGWGAAPPTAPPWSATEPGHDPAPATSGPTAPEPDLTFPSLDLPSAQESVDEAPPTVEADEDWSRPPEVAPPDAGAPDLTAPAEPEWTPPTLPEVEDPQADWQPPTDAGTDQPAPAPSPVPAPFAAPGSSGPPAAPPEQPASAPRYELPPPQWDRVRGTYLQWEPNQQAWLQWDDPAKRWKPIDT